jgi:molecular chaperone DnaK
LLISIVQLLELNAAWTAASQDMYNSTQQQGGGAQPGDQQQPGNNEGGAKAGEDVTDVPYEEVK